MRTILAEVFSVNKVFKTVKTLTIGDYSTLELAVIGMLLNYNVDSKRGNFYYVISQQRLVDIDGTQMRETTVGKGSYYKKYTKEELEYMLKQIANR